MTMSESGPRRRRPAVSCTLCRRRKTRCDRKVPCSNCVRSKNAHCVYTSHPSDHPRRPDHGQRTELVFAQADGRNPYLSPVDQPSLSKPSTDAGHAAASIVGSSTNAPTPTSQASGREVEAMKSRIRELEEQLAKATQGAPQASVPAPVVTVSAAVPVVDQSSLTYVDSQLFGETQVITRSIIHKSRMFGQSHWINGIIGLCRDIFEALEPHIVDETSKAISGVQKCKALARVIKSRRTPSWPLSPTSILPSKEVADELVDCYLRTFETVYRVLHVPTFRRDYDALWVSDAEPDIPFIVQLKLVLAIGATIYDEQFSLRASAIQWIYEAQTFISEPAFKSRRSIQFLQTNILLLQARELVNVGADAIWTSAGSLYRSAVYWGLHRDPANLCKRTTYVVEMRRRLWNTIVELNLHTSMLLGAPPSFSLHEYDTALPGNFDDDQLAADAPVPKPDNELTQMSIARALCKTLPVRLAVARFLNDLGSNFTYEEVLRLDAEVRASYKSLCRVLRECNASNGPKSLQFAIRSVDCIMHRYLAALHMPFFPVASRESTYAFSRNVVIETSLKLWNAVCPSSLTVSPRPHDSTQSPYPDDLTRLTVCASGFYRQLGMQAGLSVATELSAQLQQGESLGPVPLRPDLLAILDAMRAWNLRVIEAGDTNIKSYLLTCLVTAQIEGLKRGIGKDQLVESYLQTVEDAEGKCYAILERLAARDQVEGMIGGIDPDAFDISPEGMDDWDFMMTDVLLNQSAVEPTSWMFNEIPQVPLF
ncbi:hypothetical protein BDV25DRAFT_149100 [Aspergillus avenaceus]|uniref:Zn(2)-C6 fungal-type domain-containing protein n=1 Tax=Aspergillus avenaceus TaxID=36643 RepID=A0A5N6U4S4_ASPAV|nr:hypothetical protein BDV25DRAFT_149100 [Aspergillus avenaceus]